MIGACETLNVTSHPPERKREKRRTTEKPADTTETKTRTATEYKELQASARSCMDTAENIRGTSSYFTTVLSWIMGMFRTCYRRTCQSVAPCSFGAVMFEEASLSVFRRKTKRSERCFSQQFHRRTILGTFQ